MRPKLPDRSSTDQQESKFSLLKTCHQIRSEAHYLPFSKGVIAYFCAIMFWKWHDRLTPHWRDAITHVQLSLNLNPKYIASSDDTDEQLEYTFCRCLFQDMRRLSGLRNLKSIVLMATVVADESTSSPVPRECCVQYFQGRWRIQEREYKLPTPGLM